MAFPIRKAVRLKGYDYNTPGYYFVTVCTKEKQKLLCSIVGTGVLDCQKTILSEYGKTVQMQLQLMSEFYEDITVEKYVIMPNHVHLLIRLLDCGSVLSRSSVPTNSKISKFVGTFKRFCNKACGMNLWQQRFHDHIIRGEKDYLKIWEYIDNNPAKWHEDCFYQE